MKTRKLVLAALLIALSFIGANIKILDTIAFDSLPGFLGTLVLGPVYGGIIGAIGHFLTALTSGFPLTLPVHLVLMVTMALTMVAFGLVYNRFRVKNNKLANILSLIVGTFVNGPLSMLVLTPLLKPVMGIGGIIAYTPVLSLVAALNIILAQIVFRFLPKRYKRWR
jgi:riboflavin transporter FmnP